MIDDWILFPEKFKVGMDHKRFDIDHLEELNPNELKKLLEERDHDNVVRTEDVEVMMPSGVLPELNAFVHDQLYLWVTLCFCCYR